MPEIIFYGFDKQSCICLNQSSYSGNTSEVLIKKKIHLNDWALNKRQIELRGHKDVILILHKFDLFLFSILE